ncbi:cytochrome c oxidase accessory protein CcoG [Microvirga arsenatis]|uniref:Cytochrome c oxidase accessory protein CcoG n=1 Tax=Microvirga arsenatis TaxID=2692265 RepID=A0ABW9YYV0_9HYPH|nr:cytochrome c oxidase accessory protein CcoG [Microvirga arsenatis]NBJ11107.1 cytochrome c oxidase accessory protein CcoG [Microvirga arsenatis]NBJ25380.1 cytochrome c oxidase accessory protein CcoG [Microvirga arsenatis]
MATLDISFKPERAHLRKPKRGVIAEKVVPQSVTGRYRRIKWLVLTACLAIYYILPFLRWGRGEGQPGQAVLFDAERGRLYFFFIEIWPQEVYYLTGLLVLATLVLIWINAVAGRIWCGYLCPQTVWTDLFLLVERWIEGDRRERLKKQGAPLTARRIGEIGVKHAIWILIAMGTGGAFVLYFADAPTLMLEMATGRASVIAYSWVGILTCTTYTLAGFAREQVCTWMCPWPRLQGAIWDPEALTVNYRDYRGEPRGSAKKAAELKARGEPAGDCVDCTQCVVVCPIGIDIREGPNFACINCGLCVDACDSVMSKLGRPRGLIDYEAWTNIERGRLKEPPRRRVIRPKTIGLGLSVVALAALMGVSLGMRSDAKLIVIHDRNPVSVTLSNGQTRNGYTIRLYNKGGEERFFRIGLAGLPDAALEVVGDDDLVEVAPDATRELRVLVSAEAHGRLSIAFTATDVATGKSMVAEDMFIANEGGR